MNEVEKGVPAEFTISIVEQIGKNLGVPIALLQEPIEGEPEQSAFYKAHMAHKSEQIDQIINGQSLLGDIYAIAEVPPDLHMFFIRYAGPQIGRSLYRLKISDKKIIDRDREAIKKCLLRMKENRF